MIIAHAGKRPRIDPSARIAPNAVICGDVTVGAQSSIGFGAVLTAETGPIAVGARCVVMENAVLRGTKRHPLRLGDNVLVGPTAHLTGCTVEDDAFLATGVSVFNGARIGRRARVRINAVVHVETVLEANAQVPIGWVALGDPAELFPPERGEEVLRRFASLDFSKIVFGVASTPDAAQMPRVMARYARALQHHREDEILGPG